MGKSLFDLWLSDNAAVLKFGVSALKSDEVYANMKKMYKKCASKMGLKNSFLYISLTLLLYLDRVGIPHVCPTVPYSLWRAQEDSKSAPSLVHILLQ